MFNFQPFLSKISGGIDTAAEWFYRFKKTKGFRLTALSLALLLAALYIFGIYCNQKRLEKFSPKKIVYHMGDRIAFGENFMGMYTTANGYYVTFTEAYATSFDDFVKGNQLDASQIISWLTEDSKAKESPYPYLIVLKGVFENENCTENWDTCLDSRNFVLYSADWYGYNLIELSHFFNEQLDDSYMIFAPVGEQREVTLVFGLGEKSLGKKTWEAIEKRDFRLNLTYGPQKIDVQLDLKKKG